MVKHLNLINVLKGHFYIFTLLLEEIKSSSIEKIPEDDIDEPEPDTTLFIKNINFLTTEENITKVFIKLK